MSTRPETGQGLWLLAAAHDISTGYAATPGDGTNPIKDTCCCSTGSAWQRASSVCLQHVEIMGCDVIASKEPEHKTTIPTCYWKLVAPRRKCLHNRRAWLYLLLNASQQFICGLWRALVKLQVSLFAAAFLTGRMGELLLDKCFSQWRCGFFRKAERTCLWTISMETTALEAIVHCEGVAREILGLWARRLGVTVGLARGACSFALPCRGSP